MRLHPRGLQGVTSHLTINTSRKQLGYDQGSMLTKKECNKGILCTSAEETMFDDIC